MTRPYKQRAPMYPKDAEIFTRAISTKSSSNTVIMEAWEAAGLKLTDAQRRKIATIRNAAAILRKYNYFRRAQRKSENLNRKGEQDAD